MKKVLISLTLINLLLVPTIGLAQTTGSGGEHGIEAPGQEDVEMMDVIESITNWLFVILLIVAAIFIIIAGYFFITAMEDPDKVARARLFVLYALIGVLIGFAAKGLVVLIERIATGGWAI